MLVIAQMLRRSEVYAELAEKTELSKKDITAVFDALFDLIKREVSKGGSGEFVVPTSLLKVLLIADFNTPS